MRDTDDILPTEEWKDRLQQLIEQADTIVFLLSPQSAASEVCAWEVECAVRLNKRIAPIVVEDVEGVEIPPQLSRLAFIFCNERALFQNAMASLNSAISTDIGWIREHTRIGGQALRWKNEGRPKRLLPRGQDIEELEHWRDNRPQAAPEIMQLQASFITSARRASAQRLRAWLTGGAVSVAIMAGLSILAYIQSVEADHQRSVAEDAQHQAVAERNAAEDARDQAVTERNTALMNESRLLAEQSDQLYAEGRMTEALSLAYTGLPHNSQDPERPMSDAALRSSRHARLELREIAQLQGQSKIQMALYSHDGQRLATADSEGTIFIRNALTGKTLFEIDAHENTVTSMEFVSNNRFLLSGGWDWTPRFWSMEDANNVATVSGLSSLVTDVAVSEDRSRVAVGTVDGHVVVRDTETGKPVGNIKRLAGEGAAETSVQLEFSPDNRVLVVKTFAETRILSAIDSREIARFVNSEDRVSAFAIRPIREEIALGRQNGDIEIRSTTDGSLKTDITGRHSNPVTKLAYSSDGYLIGSIGLLDTFATISNAHNGQFMSALIGHGERLTDIAFSLDSAFALTGAEESAARMWDASTGQTIALLGGHREGVRQVGFNPESDTAFTVSSAGNVRIWTAPPSLPVGNSLSDLNIYARAVAFAENGDALILGIETGVRLANSDAVKFEFDHGLDIEVATFSSSGDRFAVADDNGTVSIHAFEEGAEISKMMLSNPASALAFMPREETLLLGLVDGDILRWNWNNQETELLFTVKAEPLEIRTHGSRIGVLSDEGYTVLDENGQVISHTTETSDGTFKGGISPDLESYAISSPAGKILLSTTNGAPVRVLQTQFRSFGSVGFSADGEILFAGGGRGGIALFDVQSGNLIARLSAHREEVLGAALLGERLLSGDYRGTVYLRPLYLDPFQSITEAGEVLRVLSDGDD